MKSSKDTILETEYMNSLIEKYGYMLKVEDLCEILQVSRPVVDRMLIGGDIPAAKAGNMYRVSTCSFAQWWRKKSNEQMQELHKKLFRT